MKNYILKEPIVYHSQRYNSWVSLPIGYLSDGATGAIDLKGKIKCTYKGEPFKASMSWWVHDKLCDTGKWDDGSPCTNLQASTVLSDILKAEGHWIRDFWWKISTYLFGGGKARDN
jgi:hypothetical protein